MAIAAAISRLLQITGLFCKRALKKRLYSAKEVCKSLDPVMQSVPIVHRNRVEPPTSSGCLFRDENSAAMASYTMKNALALISWPVCCSVLQCVAVCCSVLQCVAVCCSALQRVAACCSVLQCVAACCSVLQCVAVCAWCSHHKLTLGFNPRRPSSEWHCALSLDTSSSGILTNYRCNTLQHTATHCATHCNTVQHTVTDN